MEDVLEVYSRPYDAKHPVVCMDEKPVQLLTEARDGFTSNSTGVRYEDNEYVRNGTCSIFLFTEPLAGWREAVAKQQITRTDWAEPSARLSMERTAAGSLSTTNTNSVGPIINYISMACRLDMMISSAT